MEIKSNDGRKGSGRAGGGWGVKVFVLKEEIGWPAIFSSGLLCDGRCQRGRPRRIGTRGLYEAAQVIAGCRLLGGV